MLKVWKVIGDVEYGWCMVVVSANNKKEAIEIAKKAKLAEEYVNEWYPAQEILAVFDYTNTPRILAEEIGSE